MISSERLSLMPLQELPSPSMSDIVHDDHELVAQTPVALGGALVALVRSTFPRKLYIRLAAASGTDQIKAVVEQGMLTVATDSPSVLSPAEMESED